MVAAPSRWPASPSAAGRATLTRSRYPPGRLSHLQLCGPPPPVAARVAKVASLAMVCACGRLRSLPLPPRHSRLPTSARPYIATCVRAVCVFVCVPLLLCGCVWGGGEAAVDELSKLSWIPVSTRMRILKREMDVMKLNADSSERLEADRLSVRAGPFWKWGGGKAWAVWCGPGRGAPGRCVPSSRALRPFQCCAEHSHQPALEPQMCSFPAVC
jgi:hypothetical protein